MNKDVKYLYIAINDNKVVAFDTNLKNFVEKFMEVEDVRNYDYFYRRFKKEELFEIITTSGKTYMIQKLS